MRSLPSTKVAVSIILALIFLFCLVLLQKEELVSDKRILMKNWQRCMKPLMESVKNNATDNWINFPDFVTKCEKTVSSSLEITEVKNTDEAKYHIMPKEKKHKSTLLTLGIGHDVSAETLLKNWLNDNVELFGADPVTETNEEIFSAIGKFYPFAVGAKSGEATANVLEGKTKGVATAQDYALKKVIYVDMVHFMKNIIHKTTFDAVWIDIENAEYELFPMFHRGDHLEKNAITLCQINMEAHWPNDAQKKEFQTFVMKTLEDERYAFLKAENAGHMRLYLVNLADDTCFSRYKPQLD